MKNLIVIIVVAAMFAGVPSCNGNTAEPANTTVGEGSALPYETTAETTETATVTEQTTVIEETTVPVNDNLDDILAGYTVYDVISTTYSEVVNTATVENLGEHFALRFTDVPGCAILFRSNMIGNNGGYQVEPVTAYAFGQTADLTIEAMSMYSYERGFQFTPVSDMICVGVYPSYYVITENGAVLFDGSGDVSYRIYCYNEDNPNEIVDALYYNIWSKEYEVGQQALGELTKAYNSDDDFVCEYGHIEITDNEISLVAEERYNAGEWYKSDRFFAHYKKYRDLPGCETLAGLVALEKEYIDSGAYKEYKEFEDWVNEKKG